MLVGYSNLRSGNSNTKVKYAVPGTSGSPGEHIYVPVTPKRVIPDPNFLNHAKKLWTWFADLYVLALFFLALTGIFVLLEKKGITGRGAWFTGAGVAMCPCFLSDCICDGVEFIPLKGGLKRVPVVLVKTLHLLRCAPRRKYPNYGYKYLWVTNHLSLRRALVRRNDRSFTRPAYGVFYLAIWGFTFLRTYRM